MTAGKMIGAYRLVGDFHAAGAGNCRWTFAEREGKQYFIKEFLRPKQPIPGLPPDIAAEKKARCDRFAARYRRLIDTVRPVVATGGNTVMPSDFFLLGKIYYLIAPRIETTSLSPSDISRLSSADKLRLLRILTRAVSTIHSRNLVHCDLKPDNILIQRTDTGNLATKLIDFDGSFFAGGPPDPDDMAFDQSYMAPEVLAYNRRGGAVVAAAERLGTSIDIFSLGILLHQYWTGRRPTPPGGGYVAEAVAAGRPAGIAPDELPAEISSLIGRMLEFAPDARPSIGEVESILDVTSRSLGHPPAVKPAGSVISSGSVLRGRGLSAAPVGLGDPPSPPVGASAASEKPATQSRLVFGKGLKKPS